MVGMDVKGNAKILIAEDWFKKLGESNIAHYPYARLSKVNIGGNPIKSGIRGQVVTQSVKIILTGLKDRVGFVKNIVEKIQNYLKNPNIALNYPQIAIANFIKFLDIIKKAGDIEIISKLLFSASKAAIIGWFKKLDIDVNKWKAFNLIPLNHPIPAIGNIIWDRGIYPGFAVRDFF